MTNTKQGEMNSLRLKVELHTHTDFDPSDVIAYSARQLIDEAARQGSRSCQSPATMLYSGLSLFQSTLLRLESF